MLKNFVKYGASMLFLAGVSMITASSVQAKCTTTRGYATSEDDCEKQPNCIWRGEKGHRGGLGCIERKEAYFCSATSTTDCLTYANCGINKAGKCVTIPGS